MAGILPGGDAAPAPPLTVVRQDRTLGAAEDLDFALEMLAAAKRGDMGPTLRIYRPQPMVVLGQRDARLPGFDDAVRTCRALGFEPLVRKAGGRAAAYHQGCLILDHVEPQTNAVAGSRSRFAGFGDMYASALRRAGADAAVGEIPGEYCPGEFSVHGATPGGVKIKLIGTAQRVVSGAWLFSSVFVVEDAAPLRRVMEGCYSALGLDWDPETAGAAEDTGTANLQSVEAALIEAYAARSRLDFGDFQALAQSLHPAAAVSGATGIQ